MSDMAFTAVAKVYAGLSARRFDSDVREATAKGLTDQDPHFYSVLRYLRSPEMTPVLKGLVELSALPLKGVETDFATDSTGFSTCRFARWYDEKWGHEKTKLEWIKLHAMTGVRTLPPYQPLPWASTWRKMYHLFSYQRDTFLARYHQRSSVETTFSMIKTKFGDSLRSKSEIGHFNEVLCKVIAHNLCVLIACIHEIGLDMPAFARQSAVMAG